MGTSASKGAHAGDRSRGSGVAPLGHRLWEVANPAVHGALMAATGVLWVQTAPIDGGGWARPAWVWLCLAPLWGAAVWMNHVALTRLHEAAHGALSPNRVLNELHGVLIGTASFIPLSVYRYVHARHHAHLGRERDPEFWPYNLPGAPRALRVGYAWLELLAGWLVTPLLYSVRTAMSWRSVPGRQHGRLLGEWAFLIAAWAAVLWAVVALGWWRGFVVVFAVPAWGAGVFQTVRKFTEHLGMHGETIASMTRTVAYRGAVGRLASASQFHVDHHGTHLRHARIPYYDLPRVTPEVYGRDRLFRTHLEAIADMAPHLLDPKVGPQWAGRAASAASAGRPVR